MAPQSISKRDHRPIELGDHTHVRLAFPKIDGRADFCVYWFRKAHDALRPGQRAGLVGTNTVRQNYTREAGLDYIVGSGGTITEAVSTMIWPGVAVVHVSIVNWIKGPERGKKRLHMQEGNDIASGWKNEDLDRIPASLSFDFDVTSAKSLKVNSRVGNCFQGQTHGHEGFLLEADEAKALIAEDKSLGAVLKPFLTQDDLVGQTDSKPSRYVIDFSELTSLEAAQYPDLFDRLKTLVLPQREKAAAAERKRNKESLEQNSAAKVNHHHENFLKRWWQLSYGRGDMMGCLAPLKRYIACGQLTKRPIFEFIDTRINPNAALTVFPFDDDYTFGILQSDIHWRWFIERCSTMKADPRYTSNTVFDSFAWPQSPTAASVAKVAKAAVALRLERHTLCKKYGLSLRDLYRRLEGPGESTLKTNQASLDAAVREAYGMKAKDNVLKFLLSLNASVAAAEAKGEFVQAPGLPATVRSSRSFITADCIKP